MIELIDTHQHLIYPEVAGYGWTAGIPALEGPGLPDRGLPRADRRRRDQGTLFMEAAVDEGDARCRN